MKLPSAVLLATLLVLPALGQVRITEFMASNTRTLADENGYYPDWIELQNTSSNSVNLLNWALTDSANDPGKWRFPAMDLMPKSFLIVFADGMDRATNGAPLHTNFKLGADGEYLALFRPDGSAASEISPRYPAQFPDVSYGLGMLVIPTIFVASNAPIHFQVPTNASADGLWMQTSFDDSGWPAGTNGIGYETGLADPQEESFAAKVLASQPVAYWRLNETTGVAAFNSGTEGVTDEAGFEGAIALGQAGPRPPSFATFETTNVAPRFNGSNAYVGGPYELMNDVPAFTIAGWIYPTATQNGQAGLFGQNDTLEFGFNAASSIQVWTPVGSVTTTYPYANNQWHYVTAIGGNGQLALYFDGVPAKSATVSAANFGESEYNFNIGGGGIFNASGDYFAGLIDEVAVWERALSTNELTALLSTNAMQVSFTNFFNTDVGSQMFGSNATARVRISFVVGDLSILDRLQLLMRYDDGFAAYLNGHLIASANAPVSPIWNSTATARHLDPAAVQWAAFDVSDARSWLQPGTNVLAIQALNITVTNTDFLMQAQLIGQNISDAPAGWRYFTGTTPGTLNGTTTNDLGPVIYRVGH